MVDDADQELWRKPTSSDDPVLALVKEGRVDAEIAVRLGITNAEVKERIERLVAKHGVKNRAELREPPAPEVAEELVPAEAEAVERERVSPVHAAFWAGAIALLVGLGAGWWIRDEQVNRSETVEDIASTRELEVAIDFNDARTAIAQRQASEARLREVAALIASTPRPATDLGLVFFGADGQSQIIDSVGRDEVDRRVVTLVDSASLSTFATAPWVLERRTTGEAVLTAKVKGTYLTLRLETANDTTRIDRDGDIIRVSSTDGSKPRVKLWIEGASWAFGADGRLVVYL